MPHFSGSVGQVDSVQLPAVWLELTVKVDVKMDGLVIQVIPLKISIQRRPQGCQCIPIDIK